MLAFKSVSLEDRDLVNKYMYKYGENSCQHSFAAMFCNKIKYNDSICEDDGYLFVLRSNKCTEKERYYLFPMGDTSDTDSIKKAIEKILDDSHKYNKKVKFYTLTEKAKDIVMNLFPDKFISEENRDNFEYMYTCEKLIQLPGSSFLSKRKAINKFHREYAGRFLIREICANDLEKIKELYNVWLYNKEYIDDKQSIDYERIALDRSLDNYEAIGLQGIVIYIDGELNAFAYGYKVSDTTFDGMIQKANTDIRGIYKVLNNEIPKFCCKDLLYMNFEEDVGEEGLRKSKMMYQPDIMIKKYIVGEK